MPAAADHTVIVRKEPDLLDVRRVPAMPVALPGTPSSLMARIGLRPLLVDQLSYRLLIENRAPFVREFWVVRTGACSTTAG